MTIISAYLIGMPPLKQLLAFSASCFSYFSLIAHCSVFVLKLSVLLLNALIPAQQFPDSSLYLEQCCQGTEEPQACQFVLDTLKRIPLEIEVLRVR